MMEIVWIVPESCWGYVLSRHYGYALVRFEFDGIHAEELFEESDIIDSREMGIDYEIDEDV